MTSAALRRRLVRELRERGAIRSKPVADALTAVPREAFLPEFAAREGLEAVYRDQAIPTKLDRSGMAISSSSQPAIMAIMLEELRLEPGQRVLEVGAGTGYNAALLAALVGPRGSVTTVDVDAEIARGARAALRRSGRRATVVVGDGRDGVASRAPYDRIVVTASAETVPRAWHEQLVDGGLLEVPLQVSDSGAQVIPTLRRTDSGFESVAVVAGGFMPLRDAGEGGAMPRRRPGLLVDDMTGTGSREPLRQIWGEGLGALSGAAKRRLVAVALGEGRRRALGLRADPDSLHLYLTLALPASRAVMVFPGWALGLIRRDGRSLAYVKLFPRPRRGIDFIAAHGDEGAEEDLADAVAEWDRLGRPGAGELLFSVDYDRGEPQVRHRWRRPVRPSRGASGRR